MDEHTKLHAACLKLLNDGDIGPYNGMGQCVYCGMPPNRTHAEYCAWRNFMMAVYGAPNPARVRLEPAKATQGQGGE